MRPLENLSSNQRRATPLPFARALLGLVHGMFGPTKVAVLFTQNGTSYHKLPVEVWGPHVFRDATRYAGPWPIIAHPHCGPWGKHKRNCNHPKVHGIIAMNMVHLWGGLVEHPVGSSLFNEYGKKDGIILKVNQGDFGHMALKPTLIYLYAKPQIDASN